ncbi:hypothetical protein AA0111_g7552 [Alternaria arborescens]|uniref:hypothetical protein n=1 Tax=Alternaria arborescens TaxID=156630 RepID=UPI001075052B|nr:hypothetical protein AA0111_g7552 [Alternaria arborescens]RYO27166.1 hypothetical protein AA0111_g7552 [Alternaria arborescens]
MANGWAPIIGLIVTVIFCGAAWFLAPKGENQTYVHNIPSPKSTPTPTKPCLRTKSSLELPLANPEDRSAGRGRRVRFVDDTSSDGNDSEQTSPSTSEMRT